MRFPSGGASTTICAEIFPFAPGLFSTMMARPKVFPIWFDINRAYGSMAPPGAAGTINRIGRDESDCVRAELKGLRLRAIAVTVIRTARLLMLCAHTSHWR